MSLLRHISNWFTLHSSDLPASLDPHFIFYSSFQESNAENEAEKLLSNAIHDEIKQVVKEELDEIKKKPQPKQSDDSKKEDKSEDLINDDDDDEFVEGQWIF